MGGEGARLVARGKAPSLRGDSGGPSAVPRPSPPEVIDTRQDPLIGRNRHVRDGAHRAVAARPGEEGARREAALGRPRRTRLPLPTPAAPGEQRGPPPRGGAARAGQGGPSPRVLPRVRRP